MLLGSRLVTAPILMALMLAGCSAPVDLSSPLAPLGASTTPGPVVTGTVHSTVTLGISNQSFDDPSVVLTVTVDGVVQVDEAFAVENQHNLKLFGVNLQPGTHTVVVRADNEAAAERSFHLSQGERRWVSIFYWNFDPSREGVTWGGNETPGPSIEMSIRAEPIVIS